MDAARHLYARPIGVGAILAAILVLGCLALRGMRLETHPPGMQVPVVYVSFTVDTESSAEALEQVARPAEEVLRALPGVSGVHSTTQGGSVRVRVLPAGEMPITELAARVSEALSANRARFGELPREPGVYTHAINHEPLLTAVVMGGGLDASALADLVERDLVPAALRIPGVAQVDHSLEGEGTLQVAFDVARAAALRANPNQLASHLRAAQPRGIAYPAFEEGVRREQLVRVRSDDLSIPGLPETRLRRGSVGDVATIALDDPASQRAVLVDGLPAVSITVNGAPGADAYGASAAAARALSDRAAARGVQVRVLQSVERTMDAAGAELATSAWWGIGVTAALMLVFLRRLRVTLLVCLGLPLSLLLAVVAIVAAGRGLNIFTALGFLLALGMVVDNTIVVAEALTRGEEPGDPRERLRRTVAAVRSVALAILVGTLTTLAVFIPLAVMPAQIQFRVAMREMGMPIGWSLAASLVLALAVVPIGIHVLYPRGAPRRERSGWLRRCERLYGLGLAFLVRWRWAGLIVAVAMVVPGAVGVWRLADGRIKASLEASDIDNRRVELDVTMRGHPTVAEIAEQVRIWEAELAPHRERLGIVATVANCGRSWGSYALHLAPVDPQGRSPATIQEEVIALLSPGLRVALAGTVSRIQSQAVDTDRGRRGERRRAEGGGGGGGGWRGGGGGGVSLGSSLASAGQLQIRITAPDQRALDDAWLRLRARLVELGKDAGIRNPGPKPGEEPQELELAVSAEAELLGWRADLIAGQITRFAANRTAATLPDGGLVRIGPSSARQPTLEQLLALDLPADDDRPWARVAALVGVGSVPAAARIDREDGLCTRHYFLQIDPARKHELVERLPAIVRSAGLPSGCGATLGWRDALDRRDQEQRVTAIVVACAVIYLLMGVLYESMLAPLAVMTTVVLSVGTVVVWLHLGGVALDGMVLLGLLFLVGVAVNNGVVLVDRLVRLAPPPRVPGAQRRRLALAIGAASRRRLAPVLLTSLTTIAGAAPMALGSGRIAGTAVANLGATIAIGLAGATLMTLLVVPIAYCWLSWLRGWLRGLLLRDPR